MSSTKFGKNYYDEALQVMDKLFGKDIAMPLATVNGDKANIRVVDTYYKDGMFYVMTYALSNKIREIAKNPNVALNHNLFVAHGLGKNLGNPLKPGNEDLRQELRKAFIAFYDKHVDESDENTCILQITLRDALLFSNDYKYDIDFVKKTATRKKHTVDIIF